jgi:Fe-S cluster biogenesis protein NfuA
LRQDAELGVSGQTLVKTHPVIKLIEGYKTTVSDSLPGVRSYEKHEGLWESCHEASGKLTQGASLVEAEAAMRQLLGLTDDGQFDEPLTSDMFEGLAYDIACYLEGPVSDMLAFHSGFARLEAYHDGLVMVRLGGGCQGCPSSRMTLLHGVLRQLQEQFGEDAVMDVQPVVD